jgi:hypothetical protein
VVRSTIGTDDSGFFDFPCHDRRAASFPAAYALMPVGSQEAAKGIGMQFPGLLDARQSVGLPSRGLLKAGQDVGTVPVDELPLISADIVHVDLLETRREIFEQPFDMRVDA